MLMLSPKLMLNKRLVMQLQVPANIVVILYLWINKLNVNLVVLNHVFKIVMDCESKKKPYVSLIVPVS